MGNVAVSDERAGSEAAVGSNDDIENCTAWRGLIVSFPTNLVNGTDQGLRGFLNPGRWLTGRLPGGRGLAGCVPIGVQCCLQASAEAVQIGTFPCGKGAFLAAAQPNEICTQTAAR